MLAGQDSVSQTPTFRTEVEYVEVDALVTDADGRFVRDLTADDFEVLEDGRPQKIVNFSMVDIPIDRFDQPLFSAVPIAPDAVSNDEPFSGRVYVMVLDDLHTESSRTEQVRAAARQFIEQNLGTNDLMAVVHTGGSADLSQEFTNSRARLLASVEAFTGRKLPSATLTRNEAFRTQSGLRGLPVTGSQVMDQHDLERADHARLTLQTLHRVAEWFGNVRGRRKTMLFFSEGIDYDITDVIRGRLDRVSPALQVLDDVREAVAITARSNVSIYSIDPRGLTTQVDGAIGVGGFAGQDRRTDAPPPDDIFQTPPGPGAGGSIGLDSMRDELMNAQSNLRTLADETNGFAVINQNEYGDAFNRIVQDNSAYYVLAYYPPTNRRDGRFHNIEVRSRRPGLTVRARRGYVEPRGDREEPRGSGGVSARLLESLNSPLPVNGLRMRAFAAPFKGEGDEATVVLGVDLVGEDLSLTETGRLEVSYVAVDANGRTRSENHDRMTPNLRPENRTRVQQNGLRFLNRFELPPGRYQIRVAAHDAGNDLGGSVLYDLEVPDFEELPLSVSGVVMTSRAGSQVVTARDDDSFADVLPAAPIAMREFPQSDEIAIFAEVYDNTTSAPHRVDITTTVRADDGTIYFSTAEQRDSSELGGDRGGYGHTARIPLTSMRPGRYVLTVEARSRAGNEEPARRHVLFRVVPAR